MSSMTTLAKVHAMLPGSLLLNISAQDAESLMLSRVGTDSRQIDAGELFIALAGERFDAHDFLVDVANSGAGAALVSDAKKCPENLPAVCVSDTRIGLGELAKAWRTSHAIPLALVTGSNGKTTVKEMIASIFRAEAGEAHTLVTKGNLNNEIGLPLTLLRLRSTDALAVIELGMNHPGETARLASIAQANIALINNAQREHQEFMQTVAAVAEEHADVIRALPKDGIAVFPADSEFSEMWKSAVADRKVIDFALTTSQSNSDAVVSGYQLPDTKVLVQVGTHSIEIQLNTLGSHNVRNALAASAVALAAGISLEKIKQGLEAFAPVNGRMQVKFSDSKYTLIDDSYNANPESVIAALRTLALLTQERGGSSWAILGKMHELGESSATEHGRVGKIAADIGIDNLIAVGESNYLNDLKSGDTMAVNLSNKEEVSAYIKYFEPGDVILVKASRAEKFETIASEIESALQERGPLE